MKTKNIKNNKIINDPIYGFIDIPDNEILKIINHKYFQRLRRISQLGLAYLVFPGAYHTRFNHAIGCMHLMKQSINLLKSKNIKITYNEEKASMIAILLHDIGHGPFSHALEYSILQQITHEELSLMYMKELNNQFEKKLDLAIKIFENKHKKKFLHQLISGVIDLDRMDYLKRDSFYTGVIEGNINVDRIIKMLNIHENNLVVEEKGIYSIDKFLKSREIMYWQVYYHKNVLVAEKMLISILKRIKNTKSTENLPEYISFFIDSKYNKKEIKKIIENFSKIDDSDIIYHIKQMIHSEDNILSFLCKSLIKRELFKIKTQNKQFKSKEIEKIKNAICKKFKISKKESSYLLFKGIIKNKSVNKKIQIINKSNKIETINTYERKKIFSNIKKSTQNTYYVCYPKEIEVIL